MIGHPIALLAGLILPNHPLPKPRSIISTKLRDFDDEQKLPVRRRHSYRFFGCLAPHAKIRSQIVPKKDEPNAENAQAANVSNENAPKKKHRMGWAELLARVFAIDMKSCPKCQGELKIVAAIVEVSAIRKILGHLGLPDKPPDIAPARLSPQMRFI
jgi:hypothetical protein